MVTCLCWHTIQALFLKRGILHLRKRKSTKQTGRKNLLIHNLTGHAVDDLFELVITVGRMISGRAFEDVFDAAEAHAFAWDALLGAAVGVVVVDRGRGGETPQGDAGRAVVAGGVVLVRVQRSHELVGQNCEETFSIKAFG